MAILRWDDGDGARGPGGCGGWPASGPTVILLHGYRYDPGHAPSDPHPLLYREAEPRGAPCRRVRSWPEGLGLAGQEHGLAVAYGWRARGAHWVRLAREGRTAFAAAYDEAGRAGARAAALVARLAAERAAPVDLFAHSLGARVALSALRAAAESGDAALVARFGRLLLLGPAEFAGEAEAALDACDRIGAPTPEIYCVTARRNARYDALFAWLAPRGARRGRGPLGREGLGRRRARWLDLAFDDPRLPALVAARGVALAPAGSGPCHWSFYTRPGALALHRAILERAPGFGVEELREAGAPAPAPRRRFGLRPPRLPEPAAPLPA